MKNKKLLKNLAIVFGLLILIWIIVIISNAGKAERNFKTKLIDVDTSAVTKIVITPKSNGVNTSKTVLSKKQGKWFVQVSEKKSVTVPKDKIDGLLKTLSDIKIVRLASKSPAKWKQFQVDSASTRVQVYDGSDLAADFRVGKLNFKGRNRIYTYMRNNDEEQTYTAEGFLGATFNRSPKSFRNSILLKSNYKNWETLSFNYPADSSYIITAKNNNWYSGNTKLDSTETVKYLRYLQNLQNSNFIDEFPDSLSNTPVMSLTIRERDGKTHTIKCYGNSNKWILESSDNPESYFDGNKNKLRERIFKSEKALEN
jgi:hypothetical protein